MGLRRRRPERCGVELLASSGAGRRSSGGWLRRRAWWAGLLPLLLVAISVPAGFPAITPDNAEPFPIFFSVAFGALFTVPLVAVGLAARVVFEAHGEAR
jgi:hypothetical protein